MDDKFTRQYDYKANSNLVLPTDTSLIDKRPSNEATGEVQTLVGRISGKMGDRVADKPNVKPSNLEEDEKRRKKKLKRSMKDDKSSRLKLDDNFGGLSVADMETKDFLYQPKSDLTIAVYGLIIKFVRKKLGFQHSSIINGAADEVIGTMKDPKLDEETKRVEIERLLSADESISDDDYNELCNLCKKINDWDSDQLKIKEDTAEEEYGGTGAICPDDDDASSDEYLSEVRDSDDEFDLDDMFEKAENEALQLKDSATSQLDELSKMQVDVVHKSEEGDQIRGVKLNLEELSSKQTNVAPKIDIGEPIRKEGYHEYHIVPKKRSSRGQDYLIRIEDLPEGERKAFGDIKTLNCIQSKIYKKAMTTDQSLLICAPTGAGKTNIAILTMLREIIKHGFDTSKFKIIYIAPIKALVQEIVENFTRRLGCPPYNLKVEELTGDHSLNQKQISECQIIVCTPEKWDIVTRKSIDRLYTKLVKLVIFDEIHLLHNERGATLEALVARIKRHKHMEGEPIRIIGLSATLPNYKDVARFIAPNDSEENSTFFFDSTFRPIPLRQQYIAMTGSKTNITKINEIVYEKVIERLQDNAQILIFVHSRPGTLETADFIKRKALAQHKVGLFLSSDSAAERINELGKNIGHKLKEILQFGIGIHHAGLSKTERASVEELFKGKFIKVLVSTATLAWGVNLPARTVIIKGTQVYRDGRETDLDSLDVTQMLGRAGRPGYDREGEGIVITQQSQVAFYMSLMTEQLPVESKLIGRLAEFINAECVVGNIASLDDAVSWLQETYLASRMKSVLNSSDNGHQLAIYGIERDARKNDPKLTNHMRNLAYTAACDLDDRNLIEFDRRSGIIESRELGRIASHFNCSSSTVKRFDKSLEDHCIGTGDKRVNYTSDIDLFRILSEADDFKDIFVRRGEELDIQTLVNLVPFPIDDKRPPPRAPKVNALLQVYIFRLSIEGSNLICDMHFIRENAGRLSRALHEVILMKGFPLAAELSFDLCRKVDKRMTVCHSPLRQFDDDLDADIINRLEKKNYHIEDLRKLEPSKISELLRCERYHGEKVYKMLKFLPKLKVEASVKPISMTSLKIDLTIQPDFSWNKKYHGFTEKFWLYVGDVNQEKLLHYEDIFIKKHSPSDSIRTSFVVPYLLPTHPFYFIEILPYNWFGCDHHLPIYIERLSLPDEPIISTQLLDLEPQTIRSLENTLFERAFDEKFRGANFNQIQTQAFKHLYLSDDDVILLASAGSGKTTCAELAIIHNINKRGTASKCAYIAANPQAAQLVYDNWMKLFGRHYGVILLTENGNHRVDAARVDSENINVVIGDPKSWDALTLTSSKKHRKLLNKFQLFIFDDIHLLHNDEDSVLEWLCSKIRIITKLNSNNAARIVVLGSPLACADSLKSWLAFERGTHEPVLLNYPPSIRPVELDLTIQKYHHYDYRMRMLTMQRPVYRLVTRNTRDKPVLIFVADYNQALELCESMANYSKSDGHKFARPSANLDKLQDSNLRDYLRQGIGFIYRGMDQDDRSLVEKLYETGQIQLLVATVATCWSIQCRSYLTIIMDTQHHNGFETTDYELTDVMQMIGLTGRSLADHKCKCVIMCQSIKAAYYERFLREPLPVESKLPANLIARVNNEIAAGFLTELNNIYKPYLAHTFFYKRISINPNFYGIQMEDPEQRAKVLGDFFNNWVSKVALDLEKTEFITMEGTHENPTFNPGLLSKISREYYINYETLVNYTKWMISSSKPFELRPLELIELICTNTHEFRTIPVRFGEKEDLERLQRRHRPNERDQLHSQSFKIKLLILSQYQKTDGKEDKLEGELIEDRYYVITMAHRLLMAIVDIAWLKDSFSLAKTAIQLSKKIAPFARSTQPNLDMDIDIVKQDDRIKIDIKIIREDEQFTIDEFKHSFRYPISMFREEGWCFLVHGQPKSKKDDSEKFLLFKRVKTPTKGTNQYKLEFVLTENASAYSYDLYLMSDFYSTKEDRKVADINILNL